MVNQNVQKNRLFEELMKIKDWRHPFDFGRNRVVDLERAELGPWNKWRGEVSRQSIEMVMDIESFTILDLWCYGVGDPPILLDASCYMSKQVTKFPNIIPASLYAEWSRI